MREIESYRLRNNVQEKSTALGAKPREPHKALDHDRARRRIEHAQDHLHLHQAHARAGCGSAAALTTGSGTSQSRKPRLISG